MLVRLIGDSKLTVGMTGNSMVACLICLCVSSVMDWQPVKGLPTSCPVTARISSCNPEHGAVGIEATYLGKKFLFSLMVAKSSMFSILLNHTVDSQESLYSYHHKLQLAVEVLILLNRLIEATELNKEYSLRLHFKMLELAFVLRGTIIGHII